MLRLRGTLPSSLWRAASAAAAEERMLRGTFRSEIDRPNICTCTSIICLARWRQAENRTFSTEGERGNNNSVDASSKVNGKPRRIRQGDAKPRFIPIRSKPTWEEEPTQQITTTEEERISSEDLPNVAPPQVKMIKPRASNPFRFKMMKTSVPKHDNNISEENSSSSGEESLFECNGKARQVPTEQHHPLKNGSAKPNLKNENGKEEHSDSDEQIQPPQASGSSRKHIALYPEMFFPNSNRKQQRTFRRHKKYNTNNKAN